MALDALLDLLNSEVSGVAGVQARNHGLSGCNPAKPDGVSEVAPPPPALVTATPDTPRNLMGYQPEPLKTEACTPDTPATPKTINAESESATLAWLARIEETDAATIAEVLKRCREDVDARDYFTGRAAAGNLQKNRADAADDDRRTCDQCRNLRQLACAIAKPERGALVVANRGYRPDPARLLRCVGFAPLADDSDQRTGAERWPGLTQKGGE